MKTFALSLMGIFTFTTPALADYVILPYLFADEYCSLRKIGVSHDDALTAAASESLVEGKPIPITVDGIETTADIVKALRVQQEICPQY